MARVTAREEIVAAEIASIAPLGESFFSTSWSSVLPANWSSNAAVVIFAPSPGVSVCDSTRIPVIAPDASTPKITTEPFYGQFAGKTLDQVVLKKDSSSGAIDAITAATISSRAVTRAVHDGLAAAAASGGK